MDFTFSDQDVIRIIENNLEFAEKNIVLNYLRDTYPSGILPAGVQGALEQNAKRLPSLLDDMDLFLTLTKDLLENLEPDSGTLSLFDEINQEAAIARREIREGVQQVTQAREIVASLPLGSTLLAPVLFQLDTIIGILETASDAASVVATLSQGPWLIIQTLDEIDSLQHQIEINQLFMNTWVSHFS